MELIVVRHAETDANIRGALNGHAESEFTETGKQQVLRVAEELKHEDIAVTYSSDLLRCMKTAEGISAFHPNSPVIPTELLREIRLGKAEGTRLLLPKPLLRYITRIVMKLDITPPGGETWGQVCDRASTLVNQLYDQHQNKKVLLVTHNVTMQAIRHVAANDHDTWKPGEIVPNCTVWRIPVAHQSSNTPILKE